MEEERIISRLKASLGKRARVKPTGGDAELVHVLSVDEEGFSYHLLTDPGLYDPSTVHWWPFDEVEYVDCSDDAGGAEDGVQSNNRSPH